MFQIVTIAVDSYSETGVREASLLGARAIDEALDPHTLLDILLAPQGVDWRQLTISEVHALMERRSDPAEPDWAQLSLFD